MSGTHRTIHSESLATSARRITMNHRRLSWLAAAFCLVVAIPAAHAQAPEKTSAVAAVGPLIGDAATFSWSRVPGSTYYQLWVNDSRGAQLTRWFTAAESGCDGAQVLCRVNVSLSVVPGTVTWWVQTWNSSGSGPWSDAQVLTATGSILSNPMDTFSLAVGYRAGNTGTSTGEANNAVGTWALGSNTTGARNTAAGFSALFNNLDGADNTAYGSYALYENVSSSWNTAVGYAALHNNTAGSNTAVGASALFQNATGAGNTAVGSWSLFNNVAGSLNVAIGSYAGVHATGSNNIYLKNDGVAGESNTIRIGSPAGTAYSNTHTRAFIAGVFGVTAASGAAVFVNSSGQLGTITSSRRFKEDIRDLGDISRAIFRLRPVAFKYVEAHDPAGTLQYGLIAEEVADVMPELVLRDESGRALTVRYHLLLPLLLNEVQRVRRDLDQQHQEIAKLSEYLRELEQGVVDK